MLNASRLLCFAVEISQQSQLIRRQGDSSVEGAGVELLPEAPGGDQLRVRIPQEILDQQAGKQGGGDAPAVGVLQGGRADARGGPPRGSFTSA